MTEITQEQYQKFFDEFEKAYKEYENKVKERRARGIHDYNVFDVLETKEVKHSKFIASLLDPKGLHYQGDLFLREFINACGISDFGLDTSNAQVFREYENIDIYITDGNKHIIIENKLWTSDHDEQIARYIQAIVDEQKEQNGIYERILVLYLTPFDDEIKSLGGIDEVGKDYLKLGQNQVAFRHVSYKNEILNWLNAIKAEIINLTDLNVLISQYEKAVKNLTNQGEKMENDKVKEQIKQNYELCAEIHDNFKSAEIELTNNFFKEVCEKLENDPEIKNNWTLSFNKFENEIIPVIEITPKELNYNKYFRFVVERKPNEILYGFLKNKILDDFLKNNDEFKLENMNIQTQYFEWYLKADDSACVFAFEKMELKDFILKNIKNKNGVEEAVKDYVDKILSDIKKSKNKLKEINDKINADKQ
ncbi:PD-(D/E)XK nuclease family protein [Campylobacter sp.]|uniref:PDDEXK-like family protein n=1 Tax=Campylobacter sp. TaxID=205 RepID=UPI002A65F948|nr:PD-(D/E)XK nuclease family protein [Campylobacter sp.]MDD7704710.1 PD-(D/E)XK nuclease family protein [Campylobacteraceae bacterium]MDY2636289.1 PD-(D/E)XK nuclease family protein [Campylobacter sp.]